MVRPELKNTILSVACLPPRYCFLLVVLCSFRSQSPTYIVSKNPSWPHLIVEISTIPGLLCSAQKCCLLPTYHVEASNVGATQGDTHLPCYIDFFVCSILGAKVCRLCAHRTVAAFLGTHFGDGVYHPFQDMLGAGNSTFASSLPNDVRLEQFPWAHGLRTMGSIPATTCLEHGLFIPFTPANVKVGVFTQASATPLVRRLSAIPFKRCKAQYSVCFSGVVKHPAQQQYLQLAPLLFVACAKKIPAFHVFHMPLRGTFAQPGWRQTSLLPTVTATIGTATISSIACVKQSRCPAAFNIVARHIEAAFSVAPNSYDVRHPVDGMRGTLISLPNAGHAVAR